MANEDTTAGRPGIGGATPPAKTVRWGVPGGREAPPKLNASALYQQNILVNQESTTYELVTAVSIEQEKSNLTAQARFDLGLSINVINLGQAYRSIVPEIYDLEDMQRQIQELPLLQTMETSHSVISTDYQRTRLTRTDFLSTNVLGLVTVLVDLADKETQTGSEETIGRAAALSLKDYQQRLLTKKSNALSNVKKAKAQGNQAGDDLQTKYDQAMKRIADLEQAAKDRLHQELTGQVPIPAPGHTGHTAATPAKAKRRKLGR